MRRYTLAAALVAAAFALSSASAVAQVKDTAIARLCPDLTFGQVSKELPDIFEEYEISNNPAEAEWQVARLLGCIGEEPMQAEQADAQAGEEADIQQATTIAPPGFHPPRMQRPLPRFHPQQPRPRFAMPKPRRPHYAPPRYRMPKMARPHHAPRYAPPRLGPPKMASAGAYGGYSANGAKRPQPMRPFKTERGEPYCPKHPMPRGYAAGACELVSIPEKPCEVWRCRRSN